MANQRHVDILTRDGVLVWNQWLEENRDIRPDLREANLTGAYLIGAHLRKADLRKADLRGAHLRMADLHMADLSEANLGGVNLRMANLGGANLMGANLMGANLGGADLMRANLNEADLREANLMGALCLKTTFFHATLTGCAVYGISAWDVNLDDAKQADLRITPLDQEANITVDNLEVAQFLYLLLNNNKVRTLLDTITSKVVLILGRFSEERKPILDALREALRSHPNGYIPVLFDFDPQHDKPVLETVKTLANLARFVIADLTDPNMVRSELSYITSNLPTVPVQSVIQRDADLPTEYGTWTLFRSFLPVYRYTDLPHLLASLTEAVITPAEEHVVARRLADIDNT